MNVHKSTHSFGGGRGRVRYVLTHSGTGSGKMQRELVTCAVTASGEGSREGVIGRQITVHPAVVFGF